MNNIQKVNNVAEEKYELNETDKAFAENYYNLIRDSGATIAVIIGSMGVIVAMLEKKYKQDSNRLIGKIAESCEAVKKDKSFDNFPL